MLQCPHVRLRSQDPCRTCYGESLMRPVVHYQGLMGSAGRIQPCPKLLRISRNRPDGRVSKSEVTGITEL